MRRSLNEICRSFALEGAGVVVVVVGGGGGGVVVAVAVAVVVVVGGGGGVVVVVAAVLAVVCLCLVISQRELGLGCSSSRQYQVKVYSNVSPITPACLRLIKLWVNWPRHSNLKWHVAFVPRGLCMGLGIGTKIWCGVPLPLHLWVAKSAVKDRGSRRECVDRPAFPSLVRSNPSACEKSEVSISISLSFLSAWAKLQRCSAKP